MRVSFFTVLLVSALLGLQGCANLGYYLRAVDGQAELLERARPVADVVADPATPARLRARLATASRIRDFASASLSLPDNGSYRSYADLGRPYAAWNVFAAPEFSVDPKQWCFVVAGCVSYRGYPSEDEAQAFADTLRGEGYDVYVAGIPAYSTLGWFDDPLLNTFVQASDRTLAALVFHELAHQVVYAKDDTPFNESFATAVEREGVRRWLGAERQADGIAEWERSQHRAGAFHTLVEGGRARLREAYGRPATPEEKRRLKGALFDELRAAYRSLRESWGGYAGYDDWIDGLNNARLSSVSAYDEFVPSFVALLGQAGQELPRFYEAVRELASLPWPERRARLDALRPSPPPVATAGTLSGGTEEPR